jgi:putative ATP-dependent endonuclease of the OLD family
MRLRTLRLRNFRCYRDEIAIQFDDITAIIGKNDVGKSTITDALDIFFNDAKLERDDACKSGDAEDVAVICEFDELPTSPIIDEENATSLADEHLLNGDGRLEIHKIFNANLNSPKVAISAFARHPTANQYSDLLQLKRPDLQRRARELDVPLDGVNRNANAPIRRAIRNHATDLQLADVLVPLDKEDGRQVWEKIKLYLPAFAVFRSDRQSTDQDEEAQDPLKAAIKEAIKQKEADLALIVEHVVSQVQLVADATVAKIKEMDANLANSLQPQITPPKWDTMFKATITGDQGVPLNKRGSGVRRLVLLNFFRAQAEIATEQRALGNVIYAIEEPETSQHPDNQRRLLNSLSSLTAAPGCQVIVTTHTPMLARSLPDSALRYIEQDANGARTVHAGGLQNNERFAKLLGVLPDNHVKLFIGVEGPLDEIALMEYSKMLRRDDDTVLDLEGMQQRGEIIFFLLNGSNLALWVSRLSPLNRPEFHLYDRDRAPPDPPKYQTQMDQVNARTGCTAISTAKSEMENYVHFEAMNETWREWQIELGLTANFGDFDDVPVRIAERIHGLGAPEPWTALSDDDQKRKVRRAKAKLNKQAIRAMTRARLKEIDPNDDLLGWFRTMREMAQG